MENIEKYLNKKLDIYKLGFDWVLNNKDFKLHSAAHLLAIFSMLCNIYCYWQYWLENPESFYSDDSTFCVNS